MNLAENSKLIPKGFAGKSSPPNVLTGSKNESGGSNFIPGQKLSSSEIIGFGRKIIECITCESRFTEIDFDSHVCPNDESGNPIPDLDSPSMFVDIGTEVLELLKFNSEQMSRILREQFNIQIHDKLKRRGPFDCNLCDRKFMYVTGLQRHLQKHQTEIDPNNLKDVKALQDVVKCMECGQIFASISLAAEHFDMTHHPVSHVTREKMIDLTTVECIDEIPRDVVMKNIKYLKVIAASAILQCEFCDVLFTKTGDLFRHMSDHDSRSGFQCTLCEISVPTTKDITIHRQTDCVFVHFEKHRHINLIHFYVCNVCEEHFNRLEDLYMHRHVTLHFFPRINKHTKLMEFACDKCDFFSTEVKTVIDHHSTDHTKKALPTKKQNVSSKKPRPHLCDVCGKSYTQSSHLWQHLRFHQGIKPFACPIEGCERKFTIRPDLNDHVRKCHTGERPYHCLLCGKRFLTGSVFYQHRLIHRGERRYGCEDCGKRFYRADALKNHQRIHSGEKPYPCQHCNKSFRQRGDREKHIRARHKFLPPSNVPTTSDDSSSLPIALTPMSKLKISRKGRVPKKEEEDLSTVDQMVNDVFIGNNLKMTKSMFHPIMPSISP